jgi:hypothetical protein
MARLHPNWIPFDLHVPPKSHSPSVQANREVTLLKKKKGKKKIYIIYFIP